MSARITHHCRHHVTGLDIDVPRDSFFKPGCSTCEEKKAKGIVTGNEPLPKFDYGAQNKNSRAMLRANRDWKTPKVGKMPGFVPVESWDRPAYSGIVREVLFDGRSHAALVE